MTDKTEGTAAPPAVIADMDNELTEFFDHAASLESEDEEVVQRRILENLLRATKPEDVLRAGETMPSSEVLGIPLQVDAIRASESGYDEGPGRYLHVDATIIGNGDRITFSCGAQDVVLKLVRLHQKGWLPVRCVLRKAEKPTKAGFYPVFLRMLDDDDEPF